MKRHAVHKAGTAKDLANHAVGYVASGEGEFSRRAANAAENIKSRSHAEKTKGKHSLARLIAENESMLAYLRGRILTETNRERKEKLEKRFEIKNRFVLRLKTERDAEITTIHGADEFDAWDKVR